MKQFQSSGVLVATAAIVLVAAQPVWAAPTQVTAVRLDATDGGLNLILETSTGDRPQIFTSSRGKTLVADIINTQLRLSEQNSFRQDNPAPGIASVIITQLDPNTIRLVVTGTSSAPSSQPALRNAQGITLSISPAAGTAVVQNAPTQPQPEQTPAAATSDSSTQPEQTPDVLVPNPSVTIDGIPVPAAQTAPPTLPRAIAPPVGDIAISNVDSSASTIDLGTTERVPRLVLREAPVREVLALLARAAGLNLAFSSAPAAGGGQQGQTGANAAATAEGPTISLDIEDESVQDVFNYVLRLSGLQANRDGRTIFVGTTLPNQARDVIVRSFRLNQVTVGVALNFLVGMGAESAISRERTITSVNAIPVGGSTTPATQTQTSTETRIETQRVEFQDSIPLLRGLQALGDERTNSVSLIGSPKQVDIATSQLIQLDSRRRQVAVNVKILDVNLLATEDFNTSFSFGIGDSFFSSDGGAASVNFGGTNPPSRTDFDSSRLTPPVVGAPFPPELELGPFLDALPNAPFDSNRGARPPFGTQSNPFQPGITEIVPGTPSTPGTTSVTINPDGTRTETTTPATPGTPTLITYGLPQLFQFPSRFLSTLQAQVINGNAKILTDPTLIVQEGQQANVNLTQEVLGDVDIETNFTSGVALQEIDFVKQRVGLTLNVRVERIDDNGFISLSVAPVVSAPQATEIVDLGDGQEQRIVLISERSLNSGLIRLRDGQTLILSGIIQDSDRTSVSKVPILGDIPIIGALFRSTNRSNQRQEVIVLLTPQILDDSERSSFGYNYTPGPDARQLLERQQRPSVPER